MLDDHAIHAAAQLLAQRRLAGTPGPRLPLSCRPSSVDEGLAIQATTAAALGDGVGGWKCGLPSSERVVIGPIYRRVIHEASPCPVWAGQGTVRAEPELAFVLGRDLPPRATPYDEAEIDAAIAEARLALELIDCRYDAPDTATFPELLADGLFNQGLLLGPRVPLAEARRAIDLAITLRQGRVASPLAGRHPAGLPLAPLYWLAEFLRSRNMGLQAGQVVITGSYAGVLTLPLAQPIEIGFGELGQLQAQFAARV